MRAKILGILLTFVVIFSCFSLYSCEKNREYDAGEVEAAAKTLIEKSQMLNTVYYGAGIPYIPDASYAVGPYYMADEIALSRLGFTTLDKLKELTRAVFSQDMSNGMIDTKLTTIYDSDGSIRYFARYYQKYSDDNMTVPECLMVHMDAKPLLKDKVTYDFDSIRATHSKGENVYVDIDVTVERDDGKIQKKTISIGLIEEESGWRLSTPSYTSYVDLDYYNDLQGKK